MITKYCALLKKSLSAVALLSVVLNTSVFGAEQEGQEQAKFLKMSDRKIIEQQTIEYSKTQLIDSQKALTRFQAHFNEKCSTGILANLMMLCKEIDALDVEINFDNERFKQTGSSNRLGSIPPSLGYLIFKNLTQLKNLSDYNSSDNLNYPGEFSTFLENVTNGFRFRTATNLKNMSELITQSVRN